MAAASCLMTEDQFLCSICLDVFTDPVATPCGHNFCKNCITKHWDINVICQCPLCKEVFYRRPELRVNILISQMAAQFRQSAQMGKYYIATMTMVTASTALTIFIMNIHHCGPEARPVPQWAERFILNYLARICFVYEVGENCLGGASTKKQPLSQEESEAPSANGGNTKGTNWDVNGQAWGGKVEEDGAEESLKPGRDLTIQTDWKEDLFVTIDHSEEEGAAGGHDVERKESSSACGGGEEHVEEKKGVGGEGGGGAGGNRREILVRTRCVCQHQGLRRNVEYIANSYQDQRAAQLRIGEWRKVAKVMDRFFMWLFFIMVFFMSILILGKAI